VPFFIYFHISNFIIADQKLVDFTGLFIDSKF